jgi:chromosome segregation ATPase
MEPENLTLEVLKQIRDEGKRTGERIDQTNSRLDQTNSRINETNVRLESLRDDLGRRIVESELRTATAITDLSGSAGTRRAELITVIKEDRDLRGRMERAEKDIAALKQRLPDA